MSTFSLHTCAECGAIVRMQAQYACQSKLSAHCDRCGDFREFRLRMTEVPDAAPGGSWITFATAEADQPAPFTVKRDEHGREFIVPSSSRPSRLRAYRPSPKHSLFRRFLTLITSPFRKKPVDE